MEITIPKTSTVFSALLRADLTTLWRNRRSSLLALIVPLMILISWKGLVAKLGGAFVMSNCITIGLVAIGLMGYTNSIARDRDKGIFQRLRVAPVPSWCIMMSRIVVQLLMISVMTLLIFIIGYKFDEIILPVSNYIFMYMMTLVGGAVYLALGQVIVGRIKNPETVNSTTRLVYFAFIMIGMFGELGMLGSQLKQVTHWSPYGTVRTILAVGAKPELWSMDTTNSLLATIAYTILFAFLGIKWFKWNTK